MHQQHKGGKIKDGEWLIPIHRHTLKLYSRYFRCAEFPQTETSSVRVDVGAPTNQRGRQGDITKSISSGSEEEFNEIVRTSSAVLFSLTHCQFCYELKQTLGALSASVHVVTRSYLINTLAVCVTLMWQSYRMPALPAPPHGRFFWRVVRDD
jgi:hypothetical protein